MLNELTKEGYKMNDLIIGTNQYMTVTRFNDTGYIVEINGVQAHLHQDEVDHDLNIDDRIKVFVYEDKRGKLIATPQLANVTTDSYNWAKVVEKIPNLGVFVDIGSTIEILVSKDDLPLFDIVWPEKSDKLYVKLDKDRKGRLLAKPATEGVIEDMREWAPDSMLNQNVTGFVYITNREGTAIITNEDYRGFIHYTERKEEPRLGEQVEGRVIAVKEDGTLNISLRPLKQYSQIEDAERIFEHLQMNDGFMPFTDKSDPEDIRATFQISKAAFKRALGKLMKEGKIKQENGMTYLSNAE